MMMQALEVVLKKHDILFDCMDQCIRCLPHILNICTGHVIDALTDEDLINIVGAWVANLPDHLSDIQTYREALASNPVALGCSVIQALHASGQRQETFEDFIQEGNSCSYWLAKDEHSKPTAIEVKLDVLQLLRDMKTQWDAVHYMIHCVHYLCQVSISNSQAI